MRWVSAEGVMDGYGDGIFGSDDPVTREQFAAVLWRFAGSPATGETEAFSDESSISTWARGAVKWAKASGIITGRAGNRFDPKANITRAEAAVILYRYFNQNTTVTQRAKVLVAYFSCTHTTEGVAEQISDYLDADPFEIVPEVPYTDADLDYYSGGRADQKQADPTARPAIAASVESIEDYDIVFLGYPIWHGQAPKIIYTFLESYDFTEKKIIPFCTSHSSGIGSSADNLHGLVSDTTVWGEGKRFDAARRHRRYKAGLTVLTLISRKRCQPCPMMAYTPSRALCRSC